MLQFEAYELDERRFELRVAGRAVRLQRRVLETIFFLAAAQGRLVTKQELVAGPWRGTRVGDGALNRVIMLARRALSQGRDDAQEIITTVRGKGYRFRLPHHASGVTHAGPGRSLARLDRAGHAAGRAPNSLHETFRSGFADGTLSPNQGGNHTDARVLQGVIEAMARRAELLEAAAIELRASCAKALAVAARHDAGADSCACGGDVGSTPELPRPVLQPPDFVLNP